MLQYLTPSTLKEMYKDLDEARFDLLKLANKENFSATKGEYAKLGNMMEELEKAYVDLTGEPLWVEVTLEQV